MDSSKDKQDKFNEEFTSEKYLSYDKRKYDFQSIIKKIYNCEDLSKLHQLVPGSDTPGQINFSNDQGTWFHKKFYNSPYLPEFLKLYEEFVKEIISPLFSHLGNKVVYQKKPTFRVHLPNNVCVGQKHRDFDYAHPASEVNFWLPFTKVWGNNGIWVETVPDKADYHNIELEYGEIFRFYGNKCWHYNELNDTGNTRVSIDFRVVPESLWDYQSSKGASVKSNIKFDIGGYYDVCTLPL